MKYDGKELVSTVFDSKDTGSLGWGHTGAMQCPGLWKFTRWVLFIADNMFKVTIPSARTKGGVVVSTTCT